MTERLRPIEPSPTVESLTAELSDYRDELARRDVLLANQEGELAHAVSVNLALEAQLGSIERALLEQQTQLTVQAAQVEDYQQSLAISATRLAAVEQDLEQAGVRAEQIHSKFRQASERVGALERSWSWRLTRPLRAALRLFRGY